MINLFDDLQDVMNVTMLEDEDDEQVAYVGSVLTDDISDMEMEIEVEMDDQMIDQAINVVCSRNVSTERKMKFWEVYVMRATFLHS